LLSGQRLNKDSCAENGVWWLAHTRPRQEKAAANALFSRSVGYYLPLVTRKSLLRGRTRTARIPLFPGYIFIFGNDENRLIALKTNRLLTIDKVPDGDCLRGQLLTFAELIAAGAPLVREARLVAGERVRIRSGLFQGVEGVILRRNGKTELLIGIDFLGQGASIEVEDCNTEPV
jgi:transcriptional antiterminator RfaH